MLYFRQCEAQGVNKATEVTVFGSQTMGLGWYDMRETPSVGLKSTSLVTKVVRGTGAAIRYISAFRNTGNVGREEDNSLLES